LKLTRSEDKFLLQLNKREGHLFFDLLRLYPRVPAAHASLSKSSQLPDGDANQQLLEEALAEQRGENKKQLLALLTDSKRVQVLPDGCKLSLLAGDVEWLLQILNDIRVGSWVHLGSPESLEAPEALNRKQMAEFAAMELAGIFQMQMLEAMEGNDLSRPDPKI
jgi:hypothetical protein